MSFEKRESSYQIRISTQSSILIDILWESHKSPKPPGNNQGKPKENMRTSCEYSLTGSDETKG